MKKQGKIIGVVFIALLILLLIGFWYQNSKMEYFIDSSLTQPADLPTEVDLSSILNDLSASYDPSMYIDPTLGSNKDIKTRQCSVYFVSNQNSAIDDTLRGLCDNGFFDTAPNAIINRTNVLNAIPVAQRTASQNLELSYINWYNLIKPLLPNGACKVSLYNWVEPNSTVDGQAYPIKNAVNAKDTNRGNPKDWAYCYKPLTVGQGQTEAQAALAEGQTIADGQSIIASSDIAQPFNDNNKYAKVAFATFNVDDFVKDSINNFRPQPGTDLGPDICSVQNISGNADSDLQGATNFLIFQLDNTNKIKYFTPGVYNPSSQGNPSISQRITPITDSGQLFNICAQLLTIQLVGNDVMIVPKIFNNATIYTLHNDMCVDVTKKGTIFEKSGRIINVQGKTQFPSGFSLTTNLGLASKLLYHSQGQGSSTFGDINGLQNSLATQIAQQQTIQNTITTMQAQVTANNTALAGITDDHPDQQIQIDNANVALDGQIIAQEQSLINNLNTQLSIIQTILDIVGAFNTAVTNFQSRIVSSTFTNVDYTKESNDNNFYISIGNFSPTPPNFVDINQLHTQQASINSLLALANGSLSAAQAAQIASQNAANTALMHQWHNMGCFNDNSTRRIPDYLGNVYGADSLQQCITKAKNTPGKNYDTIGLQYYHECWAGNQSTAPYKYNSAGTANNCTAGDDHNFGQAWTQKVYSTNPTLPYVAPNVAGYTIENFGDTDRPGQDSMNLPSSDPNYCSQQCSATTGCVGFVIASDGSQNCWLKSGLPNNKFHTNNRQTYVNNNPRFGDTLLQGQQLNSGGRLTSLDGRWVLYYQTDGHVCAYPSTGGGPFWCGGPWGYNPGKLIMQTDGNLVAYDNNSRAKWDSCGYTTNGSHYPLSTTSGGPYRVVMQNDRNIVVYNGANQVLWSSGTALPPPPPPDGVGGNSVSIINGYRVHTFTSSGLFTVPPDITLTGVEVLIIGGGGGSGGGQGAAGGGGGVLLYTGKTFTPGTYTITVGTGGIGGGSIYSSGQNGGNSSVSSIGTALGGGGGGGDASGLNGNNGSSGGGGSSEGGRMGYGGQGTQGQGYVGGNSTRNDNGPNYGGGGGGGAGGPGRDGQYNAGGAGGDGRIVSLQYGVSSTLGGGGGGGSYVGGRGGTGGIGGGGNGNSNGVGTNGAPNSGGGGGGGSWKGNGDYANGGSGMVIISYVNR